MRRGFKKAAFAIPLLLVVGLACDGPSAGAGSNVPGNGHGVGDGANDEHGQHSDPNSFPELKARLQKLKEQQQTVRSTAMADVSKCEELCDLATQICEVAKRLEVIADRHPTENSYLALKREAQLECREATESCVNCVSGFESKGPEQPDPPNSTEPE